MDGVGSKGFSAENGRFYMAEPRSPNAYRHHEPYAGPPMRGFHGTVTCGRVHQLISTGGSAMLAALWTFKRKY
jgi:hypothetical protein